MTHAIKTPKKLIEVALPLDDINIACAREKSIRHGHPSTLHLWWAPRPLAAARAVIFAQMVNDPGYERHLQRGINKKDAQVERDRLFGIIRKLVLWESTNDEVVLAEARAEIVKSWRETCELNHNHPQAAELFNPDKLPAFHDPFAGGGAIPLEAQRLGLESYASDLNPVAVLINKAMIEIPPKFSGLPPVNPESRKQWIGNSDALPRNDSLAKSDAGSEGNLSVSSIAAARGNLRDAVTDHAGGSIGASKYRGGVDSRIGQGESPISGDCSGFACRDRNVFDVMRGNRLVSDSRNGTTSNLDERSGENVNHTSAQLQKSESSEIVNSQKGARPISYPLFLTSYRGAQGLAEDVRRYGAWMREEAFKRIGHLYPKVSAWLEPRTGRYFGEDKVAGWKEIISKKVESSKIENNSEMLELGETARACGYDSISFFLSSISYHKLTAIAWLWARTVKSPNPAFSHVDVPLASSFMLSSKVGKEAYVQPLIEGDSYRFEVRSAGVSPAGDATRMAALQLAKNGTKLSRGANFRCLLSDSPIDPKYIYTEGMAGRLGIRLMAIVAEGAQGRVYLAPNPEMEAIAEQAKPEWKPDVAMPKNPRWFSPPAYGMANFGDLFTPRQLVALTTFSDLVQEARAKVKADALAAWGAGVSPADQLDGRDARPPGWYRRGNKHPPHYDALNLTQFVTFRLADTLPQEKLNEWKEDLAEGRISDTQYRQQAEEWLNKGMGACWLKDERIASMVQDALLYFDGTRYTLHGWVIMPNHVHVVFSPHEPHRLAEILHSWKSYTAKMANQILGRSGLFWQDDYFDRFMRDESDLNNTLTYLAYNPVMAGLSATPEQYPFAGGRASRPSDVAQCGSDDGRDARPPVDERSLDEGGIGATAYADAVAVYLGLSINKVSDRCSSICGWDNTRDSIRNTFGRQAIQMTWDFAESNIFSESSGSWLNAIDQTTKAILALPARGSGKVEQSDAQNQTVSQLKLISTDPPYYDNIGYADLSDFFYVWLRRALRPVYPSLFATMAVPKAEELVATPYRHGSKQKAEAFFLAGMTEAMHRLAEQAHPAFPTTIYTANVYKLSFFC